jgi:hypothetical protein
MSIQNAPESPLFTQVLDVRHSTVFLTSCQPSFVLQPGNLEMDQHIRNLEEEKEELRKIVKQLYLDSQKKELLDSGLFRRANDYFQMLQDLQGERAAFLKPGTKSYHDEVSRLAVKTAKEAPKVLKPALSMLSQPLAPVLAALAAKQKATDLASTHLKEFTAYMNNTMAWGQNTGITEIKAGHPLPSPTYTALREMGRLEAHWKLVGYYETLLTTKFKVSLAQGIDFPSTVPTHDEPTRNKMIETSEQLRKALPDVYWREFEKHQYELGSLQAYIWFSKTEKTSEGWEDGLQLLKLQKMDSNRSTETRKLAATASPMHFRCLLGSSRRRL